jgi:demethylmenaquinone methyltransferase/2-methoxy-6-polyprenyl-1,4-benzoquinol methylase
MTDDARLIDYYANRANESERIYEKPERQNDLEILRNLFRKTLAGRSVFEIACGTGYWTQVVAQTAKTITATDINEEVLQIARSKTYGCEVNFQKADAFNLNPSPKNDFTAGLAAAWWSHLQRSQVRNFLLRFHRLFTPGSLLVFMDNRLVPGSNTPISRTDDDGNTYQTRKLENGNEYEILKNFPDEKEIRALLGNSAREIYWTELTYYWCLTYKIDQ